MQDVAHHNHISFGPRLIHETIRRKFYAARKPVGVDVLFEDGSHLSKIKPGPLERGREQSASSDLPVPKMPDC